MELHPENLIPLHKRAKDKQREIRVQGAIASHKVQKEKKLLSHLYAEFLAKEHEVDIDGIPTKISGMELVNQVAMKVLSKGDSSSVSMLKEIREATEGSKVHQTGTMKQIIVACAKDKEALEDDYALPQ